MDVSVTHYDVLGVAPDADEATVKAAYRAAARVTHPDAGAQSAALFLLVRSAYEVLADPARRAAYDAELAAGRQSPAAPAPAPGGPPPPPPPPDVTSPAPAAPRPAPDRATARGRREARRRNSRDIRDFRARYAAQATEQRRQERDRERAAAAARRNPETILNAGFYAILVGYWASSGQWWPGWWHALTAVALAMLLTLAVLTPAIGTPFARRDALGPPSRREVRLTSGLFVVVLGGATYTLSVAGVVVAVLVIAGYAVWATATVRRHAGTPAAAHP